MDATSSDSTTCHDDEERLAEADALVSRYVKLAAASGLIPVPLVDLALISGLQLNMLRKLSNLYDVKFSDQRGKAALVSLVSGGGALSLSSLAQAIPGIGLFVGMFAVTLTAGATTYAIGRVFIQHYESGGTLLTFDPKKVQDYYFQQVKIGKQIVQERASNAGRKP